MPPRIASFREFWPYYVEQHLDPTCRVFHFIASTNAIVCVLALVVTRIWWFAPLALVTSYGAAWVGHFVFEKNRPAAFDHPLWSLIADFKMYGKTWAGTMGAEVERAARGRGDARPDGSKRS